MKARYVVENAVRGVQEFLEDQWFDRTRNVRTSGEVSLARAGIARERQGDSEAYQPSRPRHLRRALREMPVRDVRGYSYVDLGSGKGRSLFVAAELPFRQVIGVEFSAVLHGEALRNCERFRVPRDGCQHGRSLPGDAGEFVFPDGDLVLYLFNPFGRETMARVLGNLEDSLARQPRHVVVVLLRPRCQDLVAAVPGMRLWREREEWQIFEVGGAGKD